LKQITCSKADAIGYIHRKITGAQEGGNEQEELFISFKSEGVIAGSRSRHLAGEDISVSKVVKGNEEIKVDWNKIFLKEE